MNIKLFKLKSGNVNLHLHHSFHLSDSDFYHIPILVISIGKKGFGISFLSLMIGIGWKE